MQTASRQTPIRAEKDFSTIFFFVDKVIARSHQPEVCHGSFQDSDVRMFSCLLQRAKLNVLFVSSLSVAVLTIM